MKIEIKQIRSTEPIEYHGNQLFTKTQLEEIMRA